MRKLVNIFCLSVLLWCSCTTSHPMAIQLHPTLKEELMIVPEGNKVGSHVTKKPGVYMSGDVFLGIIMDIQRQFEKDDEYVW